MRNIRLCVERLDSLQVNAVYGPGTVGFLLENVLFFVQLGISVIHMNPNIRIGTWPTPERTAGGPRIGAIPLPELMCHIPWPRPFPGFIDIPRYLGRDLLDKLIEGMPRFKVIKDIDGGIRTAHLHLQDEVVLLEEAGFKEAVQHVAAELAGQLAETAEYPETIGAIRHLTPGVRQQSSNRLVTSCDE